jgi:hypothetical protein
MSVHCLRVFLLAVMTLSTASSQAGWFCEFLESFPRETKRRNCWPKPFVCPDRQFVRTPFALQVIKGWELENTLGAAYFDAGNGQLNEAGRLKVQWILLEEPAQYRSIYVHAAQTPEETDLRLKSVREFAVHYVSQGELPTIAPTNTPEPSWPADRVDLIGRKYQAGQPVPRLPYLQSNTGGSTGGGGT